MFNSFLIRTSLLGVVIASSLFSFTNHAEARHCETIAQGSGGNIQLRANPNYNFFNFVVDYPNGTNLIDNLEAIRNLYITKFIS